MKTPSMTLLSKSFETKVVDPSGAKYKHPRFYYSVLVDGQTKILTVGPILHEQLLQKLECNQPFVIERKVSIEMVLQPTKVIKWNVLTQKL
jgi:hypothetical protein